jgi:formate dehydrogenase subunit gamma
MKLRILGLLAALLIGAAAPAMAQTAPRAPSMAEELEVQALLRGSQIQGRITIPDDRAATLIQPVGREWRDVHNYTLAWVGGIAVLGMLAILTVFRLTKGRIPIEGGRSGRTLLRFNVLERGNHWMVASTFIILALSGLNISFGRWVVMPLFGAEAFATVSGYGKLAHNYLAFPFMLGLVLMFLLWVKDNIPNAVDVNWLKQGGGIFKKGVHPPAKRFNAGQKGVFWLVIVGGIVMSVSGWYLLFPYTVADGVAGLQLWTTIHAVLAVLFIAAMFAHAYIGSVGMEGAFDAMGTGEVDLNWAKEHQSLWVDEEQAKGKTPAVPPRAMQAE